MRNLNAILKYTLFAILILTVIGCGKKEEPKLDGTGEPPIPGFVWDPDAADGKGSWVNPNAGYANGASSDEDDEYEDDEPVEDTSSDADAVSDSSNDSDPYAVSAPPEDEEEMDEDVQEDDPYTDAGDGGYGGGGTGYGDDPYGGQPQGDPREYAERVEPILRAHCYNCHGGGPRGSKGDVALNSPNAIKEADVISANYPEDSLLYEVVSMDRKAKGHMPPKGPGLSNAELKTIENWIKQGAVFGNAPANSDPYAGSGGGNGYGDDPYGGSDGYGEDEDSRPKQAAPKPENLAEWASQSFQSGRDAEAMRQLHAQALVKSDIGNSVLEQYRWVPGLKRAKLAVRWGVGIKYNAKDGFTGTPRPVGVVQNLPGDEYDDVDEKEDGPRDFKNKTLDYYTGDIGEELLLRLQGRIERAYYGDILRDELKTTLSGSDEDDDFDDDDGGYGGGGGGGYGGGGYGGGRGGDSENEKPDGGVIEQIMPGVTLVGEASSADLFKRALEQDVDLLVVFDVVADPNKLRKFVNTSTRVRLYDVRTKEQVAVSGKINNVDIQKALAEETEDETVIKEMDKIFAYADKQYRVKDFPDVTSAKAQKSVLNFVRGIFDHPSKDPLWKLAEVRFYEQRGALKPSHAEAAFKKILPQQAAKLKDVKDDNEIRTTLSEWLIVDDAATGTDEEDEPENTFR